MKDAAKTLSKISVDFVSKPPFGGAGIAAKQAADALRLFGDVYYGLAERCYKYRHGKLPGSDRTKRLHKKRKMSVLKWFYCQIKNN